MGKGDTVPHVLSKDNGWLDTPTHIDKWNSRSLKLAIDDHIWRVLEKDKQFTMNYRNTDVRIILEALMSVIGIGAFIHGMKYPFPESRDTLIICLLAYYILVVVHSARDYMIGNKIVCGSIGGINCSVSTSFLELKPFSMELSTVSRGSGEINVYKVVRPVEAYFHEDGYLAQNIVYRDVQSLVKKALKKKATKATKAT